MRPSSRSGQAVLARVAAEFPEHQRGRHRALLDRGGQPHLGVDRLAGRLELLLMLVLGSVEQLAQDAVVQVDDFVGDGGHALDGERTRVA